MEHGAEHTLENTGFPEELLDFGAFDSRVSLPAAFSQPEGRSFGRRRRRTLASSLRSRLLVPRPC